MTARCEDLWCGYCGEIKAQYPELDYCCGGHSISRPPAKDFVYPLSGGREVRVTCPRDLKMEELRGVAEFFRSLTMPSVYIAAKEEKQNPNQEVSPS